jgi:hypothetical protein
MFKLDRKLSPDEFIQTFFEANKSDHQRPPHPWETLFRGGKCTKDQLQGWAKERYYFVKNVPTKEYSILVLLTADPLEVIIGEFTPPRFELAAHLLPLSCQDVLVHGIGLDIVFHFQLPPFAD